MNRIREFLQTKAGQIAAYSLGGISLLVLGWMLASRLGDTAAAHASQRVFIDAATKEVFHHRLSIGEAMPVPAPSGANTGYEAEACYWTADGGRKDEPTWVLPMSRVDPEAGPTFCPDCGRLVTELNAHPETARSAPPTRAEFEAGERTRLARGRSDAGSLAQQASSQQEARN